MLFAGAVVGIHLQAQAVCWQDAGARHGIDPTLLKAMAWKESHGRPDAIGPRLQDGNRALGVMQINSIHLGELAQYGISQRDLFEPCLNEHVAAWILAKCIRQFGAVWKAVGCYYTGPASRNLDAQREYVRDVQQFYHAYLRQEQSVRAEVLQPANVGGTGL